MGDFLWKMRGVWVGGGMGMLWVVVLLGTGIALPTTKESQGTPHADEASSAKDDGTVQGSSEVLLAQQTTTQLEDGTPLYSMGHPIPHPNPGLQPGEVLEFDTSCPSHCTGHGECVNGKCLCEENFVGE